MLGYATTAQPDVTQWGPQPYEGIVSVICEEFGCTPSQAEREEWPLVRAVLDYRAAVRAKEVFEGKDRKKAFEELSSQPHLLEMLAKMHRAQAGLPLDGRRMAEEGMAVAQAHRSAEDKDDDGDAG